MHFQDATNASAARAAATDWFLRLRDEPPSTETVLEWQQWLAQDETHRKEFSRLEDLWDTLGQTQAHLQAGRSARSRRRPLAIAASILVAAFSLLWWRESAQHAALPASAAVETNIAESRSYALVDGSHVQVGARSRVVVNFNTNARSVVIDSGEAYFDVAHDETRPFVVRAGSGTVTAVGTAFAVRNLNGRVTVSVVNGTVSVNDSVAVDPPHPPTLDKTAPGEPSATRATLVHAGEAVVYDRSSQPVQRIDAAITSSWRSGHLKYVREPLQFVVDDVERYTNLRILIAEPAVGELVYTGTVFQDRIEPWLGILADAFPIEVVRIDSRTVLLKHRADHPELATDVEPRI